MHLSQLFYGDPSLEVFIGRLTRRVLLAACPPMYGYILLRRRRPTALLVWDDHRLVGGVLITRYGGLQKGALATSGGTASAAIDLLRQMIRAEASSGRYPQLTFSTPRRSLLRIASRFGFQEIDTRAAVRTLDLGAFRFSWLGGDARLAAPRLGRTTPLYRAILPLDTNGAQPEN